MNKIIAILLTILLIFSLCACGGADTSTPDEITTPSSSEVVEEISEDLPFKFTITKTEVGKDYKGNDTIFIYFDWTNTTNYTLTFNANILVDAFQSGTELDTTFPDMLTELYELYNNQGLKIKPGTTQSLVIAFVLNDTENSIHLEVDGFKIPEETTAPPTAIVELN